jgi:hypothetical protein
MSAPLWMIVCAAVLVLCVLFIEPLRKIFALVLALAVAFAIGFLWPGRECQHVGIIEANYIPAIFGKR